MNKGKLDILSPVLREKIEGLLEITTASGVGTLDAPAPGLASKKDILKKKREDKGGKATHRRIKYSETEGKNMFKELFPNGYSELYELEMTTNPRSTKGVVTKGSSSLAFDGGSPYLTPKKHRHQYRRKHEDDAAARLADMLFEAYSSDPQDDTLRTYTDRLALRIFEFPSLMSYLNKIQITEDTVELDFYKFPYDIIENVRQIIGPETEVKIYEFHVEDRAHIGFRIRPDKVLANDDEREQIGHAGNLVGRNNTPSASGNITPNTVF